MLFFDTNSEKWISLRETAEYKQRRKIIRDCWIPLAFLMLFVPPPYAIILALAATFLSFMFLDEVEYASMKRSNK